MVFFLLLSLFAAVLEQPFFCLLTWKYIHTPTQADERYTMSTLQEQLETASLSEACKADLMKHIEQIELQSATLPKRNVTVADANLPDAVNRSTKENTNKTVENHREDAVKRFETTKRIKQEAHESVASDAMNSNSEYFKNYSSSYKNQPTTKDPFRQQRDPSALSGKDEDFVHRYAEALSGSTIEREEKSDPASVTATEAYKKAFQAYTGRQPNAKELVEASRLNYAFDEHGNVGVIQKPHASRPHTHISNCKFPTTQCNNQVYRPENPPVRGARDQYPGPVPVWSSTKNVNALVAGDMHIQEAQVPSTLKRDTVNAKMRSL
ncbi:hypothetical protein STCU_02542 [Strigomonas culicis]|uniref:Uncharacterized protein n=1 Tax=Strigomonas culicis TaxID=28005 RepID=S9VKS4_9TRYP|nr:hypothetical protein STCU_07448 [Strigomonas culicis]EPY32993.1 hypothetical protein STCU_02542 [Strigomonas culicis]|eukprot:EPY23805.1 hypothetical protein STCU_07448 [Strigomonas culicis]